MVQQKKSSVKQVSSKKGAADPIMIMGIIIIILIIIAAILCIVYYYYQSQTITCSATPTPTPIIPEEHYCHKCTGSGGTPQFQWKYDETQGRCLAMTQKQLHSSSSTEDFPYYSTLQECVHAVSQKKS